MFSFWESQFRDSDWPLTLPMGETFSVVLEPLLPPGFMPHTIEIRLVIYETFQMALNVAYLES